MTRFPSRAVGVLVPVLLLTGGCAMSAGPPGSGARVLLWHDEFAGATGEAPDPGSWTHETGGGGWGNGELQTYTTSRANSALDGHGHLVITARREVVGDDTTWTSARITTSGKRTAHFGRVEVRAHVPAGQGSWPAVWMLGQDIADVGWPACGEIDLVETVNTAQVVMSTVHGPDADGNRYARMVHDQPVRALSEGFHVYSAEWTPDSVEFAVDGAITGTVSRADVPVGGAWALDSPMYLLLNIAVGGSFPGRPDATTPEEMAMTVDWVRFFAPRG